MQPLVDGAGLWNMLMSGNIIGSVLNVYTSTMDVYFYYLILMLAMFMIYIKIQNFTNTVLIGILVGAAFLPLAASYSGFASAAGIIYFMIVMAITLIFYKVFKG
jgi:hypothetical protein